LNVDSPSHPTGPEIFVIGYGSTLRSDDSAGPRAAAAVGDWALPGVRAMAAQQLTPDLAAGPSEDAARCRVHFMRNLLATVSQGAREPVAALVRTIFAQPDHATATAQLRKVADGLRGRFRQATTLLERAAEDILAYLHSRPPIAGSSTRRTRLRG
jgi:hypothetical protein